MTTKRICVTALGIALYVVVSMTIKIPMIAHISLDLGYIVLAVYCYHFGPVSGAIVGGAGCVLISLLTSGWFPPGWLLGNIAIGGLCGSQYKKNGSFNNIVVTVLSIATGIWVIKTAVECTLYGIPVSVKLVSNGVAAITDAVVMCIGVLIAQKLHLPKKVWGI